MITRYTIGIRIVDSSVSGLRESLSRSRRMMAHIFMMLSLLANTSSPLRHPGADEQTHLLRGLIAQRAAGQLDENILQRNAMQIDRGHLTADVIDAADQMRQRMRTIARANGQLAVLAHALDVVDFRP